MSDNATAIAATAADVAMRCGMKICKFAVMERRVVLLVRSSAGQRREEEREKVEDD